MNTVVRTKIDVNPANARNISGLDDLARIVFPDSRTHRRVFVAIWLEVKYAEDHFVPSFTGIEKDHGFSERVLEVVRARMKKMGILKRISHFNPHHGHTSGWAFSDRFGNALNKVARAIDDNKYPTGRRTDEQKDRDSITYV